MLTIDNACNTSKMKLQSGTLLHDLLMLRHGQITKPSDLFSPPTRSLQLANLSRSPVRGSAGRRRQYGVCRGPESDWLRRPFQGRALPMSYLGTGTIYDSTEKRRR